MAQVSMQIQNISEAICQNIDLLDNERALLSQNILSQLRNLVESVAVLFHTGLLDAELNYEVIQPGLNFVKGEARLNFLGKFHRLIQISASHYTMDGDSSERLMLKYYEYLLRIRNLLQDSFGIRVLENLESFPVDLDPSLREYHEKIATKIESAPISNTDNNSKSRRYYIHTVRPFFVYGRIFYEITFYHAVNKASKSDRIIAFTDIDITDKYAATLTLQRESIDVLNQTMPVTIIREWEVSIRPCEFNNFARLLGIDISVRTNSREYRYLMYWLTKSSASLLDLVDMTNDKYVQLREECTDGVNQLYIFPMLDKIRSVVRGRNKGSNLLRYLMLRMRNSILKLQYDRRECNLLSQMKVSYGCIPFETMPFCTSLCGHNPRYWDLAESIDVTNRNHELLARCVKNNVEHHGILYTAVSDLERFGDVPCLISTYNNELYHKHQSRRLVLDKGYVFICGYENETVSIIKSLQEHASSRIDGYSQAIERWLDETPSRIDDTVKEDALKQLFSQSHVALIYGAAGTGKSTMVNHIAHYFNDKEKLFLAHTNPAIDNLKRKVTAQKSEFRTISSQIGRRTSSIEYDLLVIDECSTVSNTDLIKVLKKTSFKLLILVGDVYQIKSIQFGNWFGIIRSFIPCTSVFELTTPFRTTNESLLNFWNKVRCTSDDLSEVIARNGYSAVLDKTLFESQEQDEIILCLNYDGLYGINNINRFLQSGNSGKTITWCESTYKVGDPVLFHDGERFWPVIYNNLKGRIIGIETDQGKIQFDIELDRPLSAFDIDIEELEYLEGSIVRFPVYECDASDEDDDSMNVNVPFQVAYAVSIHKAQGLEFDTVKVVITDSNEDSITHNIFYTAVTRARARLQIFWTPETQQRVLQRLCVDVSSKKDVSILTHRCDLARE